MADGELLRRQQSAERALLHMGITFNVYGDGAGTERIFPFDLLPRIVTAVEWDWIEQGLKQRIRALNLFIDDIYHAQKIVKDGVVPEELVRTATSFREVPAKLLEELGVNGNGQAATPTNGTNGDGANGAPHDPEAE